MNININELTLGQIKELVAQFGAASPESTKLDNGMLGQFVIVRCHDAGVHAGYLESYNGREAVLTQSRRLWYWKPANKQKYLSGVAVAGLDSASKIGACVGRIHLTETCELIQVHEPAINSILKAPVDEAR